MAPDDVSTLVDAIEQLLHEPPAAGLEAVERIERTLTDGYAGALALEGERLRLERRIAEEARTLAGGADPAQARDLAELYDRLAATDADLERLRSALASLQRRHAAVRAA